MTDTVERADKNQIRAMCEILKTGRDISDGFNKAIAETIIYQDAEIERLREALKDISSPAQTKNLSWWQKKARAALSTPKPKE